MLLSPAEGATYKSMLLTGERWGIHKKWHLCRQTLGHITSQNGTHTDQPCTVNFPCQMQAHLVAVMSGELFLHNANDPPRTSAWPTTIICRLLHAVTPVETGADDKRCPGASVDAWVMLDVVCCHLIVYLRQETEAPGAKEHTCV